jgi:hypothetical protein
MSGVKTTIGVRLLNKRSKEKERIRLISSFEKASDIMVCWDNSQWETDARHINAFLDFLKKEGKNIETVVYHHANKREKGRLFEMDSHVHLMKADFNTFGLPKTTSVKKLLAKRFDYFINLNMEGRLALKSIAGLTNSTCRIGFHREKSLPFYDILLGNPASDSIEAYINDLKHYLHKIG